MLFLLVFLCNLIHLQVVKVGLPNTWSTLFPFIIRFAPIPSAIFVKFVTCTIGKPARWISFVIMEPPRELVPQVDVSITASTPSLFNSAAIPSPNSLHFSIGVITPAVE